MSKDMSQPWWGEFALGLNTPHFWTIGPLRLCMQRHATEWLVAHHREGDYLVHRGVVASKEPLDMSKATETRIAFRNAPEEITVKVALADRAVVVRADKPLSIPAGERVTILVSTATWMQLSFGDGMPVMDIPTMRPPDTWFGPDSRHGELCYASRTRAKMDEAGAGHWIGRAITPVRVRNQSGSPLLIEQIKLPIPNLFAYADKRGYLWTDAVLMECKEASGAVMVRIDSRERAQDDWTRVAAPRVPVSDRRIPQAFALLFGQGGQ